MLTGHDHLQDRERSLIYSLEAVLRGQGSSCRAADEPAEPALQAALRARASCSSSAEEPGTPALVSRLLTVVLLGEGLTIRCLRTRKGCPECLLHVAGCGEHQLPP